MSEMKLDKYMVAFREDTDFEGNPGRYWLKNTFFDTNREAWNYAKTVASSRYPIVMKVVAMPYSECKADPKRNCNYDPDCGSQGRECYCDTSEEL